MRNVGNNGNQKGKELFISNYPIAVKQEKTETLFGEYDEITSKTFHIVHNGG